MIPVTILTGFLGAGKTTVLQKILAGEHYGDSAVLINEFGEVGIDQQLVRPISPNVVLLDSGCLCCQIRGELKDALADLLHRRATGSVPPFRQIIIETTGLAEPTPIIATLQADPQLSHQLAAERTVTVVDAVNGEHMAESGQRVWLHQAAAADLILISKADLAPQAAAALAERLHRMLPGTPVLPLGLSSPLPDFNALPATRHAAPYRTTHQHGSVQSLALEIEDTIDWIAFGVWLSALLHAHGNALLRVKGILHIGESYPVLINAVQHMVYPPQHLNQLHEAPPHSQLVLIADGLDPAAIERSFRRWVLHSDTA
ncbi:GTP-binding protein [Eikenella sp. Marseille-P7795]|uniref:CobW family GTP-binding protein n=1 Tax=Eikenella sp. Marseille-P7795 TaxID=2866577 RepID=UPI001CE3FE7C|nr:GTP-binding protein [Eikenella sp. Marseille-P7795]